MTWQRQGLSAPQSHPGPYQWSLSGRKMGDADFVLVKVGCMRLVLRMIMGGGTWPRVDPGMKCTCHVGISRCDCPLYEKYWLFPKLTKICNCQNLGMHANPSTVIVIGTSLWNYCVKRREGVIWFDLLLTCCWRKCMTLYNFSTPVWVTLQKKANSKDVRNCWWAMNHFGILKYQS